jgi:hypothetical protein
MMRLPNLVAIDRPNRIFGLSDQVGLSYMSQELVIGNLVNSSPTNK